MVAGIYRVSHAARAHAMCLFLPSAWRQSLSDHPSRSFLLGWSYEKIGAIIRT